MSTFYGGPQLTSVTSVSGTQGNSVIYTVPTGYFASISGSLIKTNTTSPLGAAGGISVGGQILSMIPDQNHTFSEITLPQGTVISRFNNSGGGGESHSYSYYIGIKLYKIP